MLVKDQDGKEIEIVVYGKYEDDIQIDDAYYVDSDDEVTEDTIDYIYNNYQAEMYESWYENQCGASEAFFEGDR